MINLKKMIRSKLLNASIQVISHRHCAIEKLVGQQLYHHLYLENSDMLCLAIHYYLGKKEL